MKHLIYAILLIASVQALVAVTTINLTFVPNNPVGSVEYFVELKVGDAAAAVFEEKAKGPASPIIFTIPDQPVGTRITGRVRARHVASGKVTTPSNDTFDFVPPNTPGQSVIVVTRSE